MNVTISISSYNQADFLHDAIESAVNQFTPAYEILVIDDGSTDNSLEIAQGYQKKYPNQLRVVSQVNKGLASARNTGIMNTAADWILFLDADDILLPNCLEEIEKKIVETDADVIGLSFQEFGIRDTKIILMAEPTIEDFKTGNRIGYCSAIKRSVLAEVGGYSPRMIWGAEDYSLWFDLLKRGKKIVTIPQVLWFYRVKESSMWTETAKHKDEYMTQIMKDHKEIFKNNMV